MKIHPIISLILLIGAVALHAAAPPSSAAQAAYDRAMKLAQGGEKMAMETFAALAEAVELAPDLAKAHEEIGALKQRVRVAAYRNKQLKAAFDALSQAIEDKYAEWEKRFPESKGLRLAIGTFLYREEDPKAKPYLLEAAQADPTNAQVWYMLYIDAQRWGDNAAARTYLLKATQAAPDNARYAGSYAYSLKSVGWNEYEAAAREVARRFPNDDAGRGQLYLLGYYSSDVAKRISIWEEARARFPAPKFPSTPSTLCNGLYEAYLRVAPEKAITLAREMAATLSGEEAKEWAIRVDTAKAYLAVRTLADYGNFKEAATMLENLQLGRRSSNQDQVLLLKAEIAAGAGDVEGAFAGLLGRYSSVPTDDVRERLIAYGAKLGKSATQVDADVWAARNAAAKPAPAFDLEVYGSDRRVSLAGLRGKVVFVTFWFPGCGPCRAEMPYFENVVKNLRGNKDFVYLGINGVRKQDDYVMPFMAETKYSFTALKADEKVTSVPPEGYLPRPVYPSNFLIDRDGRIIFTNFGANSEEEGIVVERMIESLLAHPAST